MSDIFISDLHLSEDRPDIYRAFCRFLHDLDEDVQQLYILGDLFEAWIGEDARNELAIKVIAELRLLAKRKIRVFFQQGNRDFLIGKSFAKAADIELLPDHYIYEYRGRHVLLMHGDLLCTDDKAYMRFRSLVHNPAVKGLFSLLPISTRRGIGKKLRAKSSQGKMEKSAEIMDVNQSAVIHTMEQFQVTEMIHGHTHRPKVHRFGRDDENLKRYVLGDWDENLWWIVSDAEGITLNSAPLG
ncbi:MAG: UDP-2,3-diacylglucosamine diphosphatase [Porticoccaceae bacterium]|jgi:UDP-2,3-diacylglucosamine hydrolase|nr:UDP-2,3-diacylglucosamine diphosphatase [Porticoccaceae bacterium]